jgi:hypothetical protein
MLRKTAVLALVAALSVPVTFVAAAKPPGKGQITIAAAPNPINFGGSTGLTGKLTGSQAGGQALAIEANPAPFTAGFKQVTTVTTDANGHYAATVKPGVITRYRAKARTSPPTVSSEVPVGVRIRVGVLVSDATPRRGTKVVFSGRAYPAHDGALVSIQKRTPTGSFTTIARTRLLDDGAARSRYRRTVSITRSGVYRVRVSNNNDGDHQPGISRRRKITVH